jgi:type IV pilus assembly protein PilN
VIRTNLSTRPFYNERIVHLGLMVAAIAVAAATAFNAARIVRYSSSDTKLASQASHDEERAADLRKQAAKLRASVDPKQVDFASADARQANELIDRRTFSWTELFNRFETTVPDDVRITSVRPKVDRDRGILLDIAVAARGVDDVDTFIANLEATGAFTQIRPSEEHPDDQGLLQSTLEAVYTPSDGKPAVRGGSRRR